MGLGRWCALAALGVTLGGAGCGGHTDEPKGLCHADADCAEGERCDASGAADRPLVGNGLCPYVPCSSTAPCGVGMVCGPRAGLPYPCGSTICQESCATAGCEQGDMCGTDGLCTLVPCHEENGLVCPERWQCAPGRAGTLLLGPGSDLYDQSTSSDRVMAAGCVPLRCDEEGGFACRELWTCEGAGSPDASGCVAEPCAETGRCSDDATLVCAADVAELRGRTADAQGCVTRNCLEGYACTFDAAPSGSENPRFCAPDDPRADRFGCVLRSCDEVENLCGNRYCDVGSLAADNLGCRAGNCKEYGCPDGLTCDPESSNDPYDGCVPENGRCVAAE